MLNLTNKQKKKNQKQTTKKIFDSFTGVDWNVLGTYAICKIATVEKKTVEIAVVTIIIVVATIK